MLFNIFLLTLIKLGSSYTIIYDTLDPYPEYAEAHINRRLTYREIKEFITKNETFLNDTIEYFKSQSEYNTSEPLIDYKTFLIQNNKKKYLNGHFIRVQVPRLSVHVYESNNGGCQSKKTSTVQETSIEHDCLVSINAGYFRQQSGECLGNVISDGRIVQYKGLQNAHFAINKQGYLIWGYFPPLNETNNFLENITQMVGGVIWIIRNGKNYVSQSTSMEYPDTQTGNINWFTNVISARTVIGNDRNGRLIILQIDGKTEIHGANLYEIAEYLLKMNVVNAINLDGGGSSTLVINNTLVNYPSDICTDEPENEVKYQCARSVTTILCIKQPTINKPNKLSNTTSIKTYLNDIKLLKYLILVLLGFSIFATILIILICLKSKKNFVYKKPTSLVDTPVGVEYKTLLESVEE